MWDIIIAGEDPQESVESFEASIRSFIDASHSAAEDQQELSSHSFELHRSLKESTFNHSAVACAK
jgi:hypothetical protein